jgi:hypothetical protein
MFAVSDMIWLSGQHLWTKRRSKKLDHRFYGPYPVVKRVSKQEHCLKLLQEVGKIHNVFHVSLLESHISDRRTAPKPLLPIELDSKKKSEFGA